MTQLYFNLKYILRKTSLTNANWLSILASELNQKNFRKVDVRYLCLIVCVAFWKIVNVHQRLCNMQAILRRFADTLMFNTTSASYAENHVLHPEEFQKMHKHLQASWPKVHETLTLTKVEFSLLLEFFSLLLLLIPIIFLFHSLYWIRPIRSLNLTTQEILLGWLMWVFLSSGTRIESVTLAVMTYVGTCIIEHLPSISADEILPLSPCSSALRLWNHELVYYIESRAV